MFLRASIYLLYRLYLSRSLDLPEKSSARYKGSFTLLRPQTSRKTRNSATNLVCTPGEKPDAQSVPMHNKRHKHIGKWWKQYITQGHNENETGVTNILAKLSDHTCALSLDSLRKSLAALSSACNRPLDIAPQRGKHGLWNQITCHHVDNIK